MANYQQLIDEVQGWLNRRDLEALIPGWTLMVETEIAETLRARCQVVTATQPIDNAYITLPPDFATMESIRDQTSGEQFDLKDTWSGHWTDGGAVTNQGAPCTAYRLVANCIEFLPHPWIPATPDPAWRPQQVMLSYYARPRPLLLPADSNTVLENLYGVYLWGLIKHGALFELDDDRSQQADAQWQQVVTRANLWHQQSNYSGAPYRAEMAVNFA